MTEIQDSIRVTKVRMRIQRHKILKIHDDKGRVHDARSTSMDKTHQYAG